MWDYRAAGSGRKQKAGQNEIEHVEPQGTQVTDGIALELPPESDSEKARKMRLIRLRSEIALGKYRISSSALAESMLSHAAAQRAVYRRMYSV